MSIVLQYMYIVLMVLLLGSLFITFGRATLAMQYIGSYALLKQLNEPCDLKLLVIDYYVHK